MARAYSIYCSSPYDAAVLRRADATSLATEQLAREGVAFLREQVARVEMA
jgi:hypothetical protein